MNVLLIAPPIMDVVEGVLKPVGVDALRECPPLGIYSIASSLRENGHQVEIADLIQAGTHRLDEVVSNIWQFDLIGIGATSMAWPTAVDVIKQIRQAEPQLPIVCGGVHASLFDDHILLRFDVQFVLRGEAENSILELCEHLNGTRDVTDVSNLSWRNKAGEVIRNTTAGLIKKSQLAGLPEPDLSILEPGAYKCLAIESSRGCAFDCSFCSTPYRKSWRGMGAEEFVARFERLLENKQLVSTEAVHIIDDEFCLNTKRATQIAALMNERGLNTKLLYDARAQDVLVPGLLEEIAPLTAGLLIGAECGYDAGLKLVGKGSTCATLTAAAKKLSEFGIASRVDFSFIIGLPWESIKEIQQTVEFATNLYTEYGVHIMLQWYRQIPGSRLWDMAAAEEKVSPAMYDDYGFFGDYHLFSTGCQLKPSEIYKVGDLIAPLSWLSELDGRARPSIVHTLPTAVTDTFPRDLVARNANKTAEEFKLPNTDNYFQIEGVRS